MVFLWPAIEEFMASNDEWSFYQKRKNNGFTVLNHNNKSVMIPFIQKAVH
jgi:hypothetical protein